MEYLEGQTLQSLLFEKRIISTDQLVEMAKQVCAGLDYAHSRNVIHRDIKPANIMITGQNVAKIMDFGIAKSVGSMTSSGQVLGTPNYMSPEQVKGQELDGRSDLFSFGVVLYEMATGQLPFRGDTSGIIFDSILHGTPVAPVRLNPDVVPRLEDIISKSLEKDREVRYQSAVELKADLKRVRRDTESQRVLAVSGQTSHLSTSKSKPWLLVGVVVIR